MAQPQSIRDPFGIAQLVDQINIEKKARREQPIIDLKTELLQGKVEQQRGSLADLAAQRQSQSDLQSEITSTPGVNTNITTLNFLKKRNPAAAQKLSESIFARGGDILKLSGGEAATKFINDNTGLGLEYGGKTGEGFHQVKTKDKVIILNDAGETVRTFDAPVKGGETITTNPDGSVEIRRGVSTRPRKFTEVQTKSGGFADRVKSSNELLNELEDSASFDPASISETIAGSIPGAGNILISPEKQRYNQAKQNFITANLRLESGAAIGKDEFVKEDKKFFPQPGDSPSVIKQKRDARTRQFDILRAASSGFYDEIQTQRGKRIEEESGEVTQPTEGAIAIVNPETGERLTLKNGAWVKNGGE